MDDASNPPTDDRLLSERPKTKPHQRKKNNKTQTKPNQNENKPSQSEETERNVERGSF